MKKGAKQAAAFTCTEHFGTENVNDLVIRPLVDHINEAFGREVVVARHEQDRDVTEEESVIAVPVPELRKGRKKKSVADVPIAQ